MDGNRKMKPHCNNACSGKYSDWLEVNLLPECNAKCSWCIEKKGWHPSVKAPWFKIATEAIKSGKKNIILLGGEPTLYPYLRDVIKALKDAGKNIWITTNGSMLTGNFAASLRGIKGINISIHHYDLIKNEKITGLKIGGGELFDAITELRNMGVAVRLNCNCIKGYIDSEREINCYITFAKALGVDSVRFAELKDDNDHFVNLFDVMGKNIKGLTDDPYANGCSVDTEINGMKVNFRLMCGLQTTMRVKPNNPEQVPHTVLYYDGKTYDGWQVRGEMVRPKIEKGSVTMDTNKPMTDDDLLDLLRAVKRGEVSVLKAANDIKSYSDAQAAKADKVLAQAETQALTMVNQARRGGTDHCHY